MQRNWIGRSEGASIDFPVADPATGAITVFTTRPDTLFGATYMVLAPEHPLVDARRCPPPGPTARRPAWTGGALVAARRRSRPTGARSGHAATSSARSRAARRRASSSAPTPSTRPPASRIPIFVADYVLMGYGTGAIMAVPGQDQRDWDFAEAFDLPIVRTVAAARRLGGQGVHRRGSGDRVGLPRRAGRRRRQAGDDRLAGAGGLRLGHRHLQAARLAVQPPALLGRAVPHRLRRDRPAHRPARVRAAGAAARDRRLLAPLVRPRRRAERAAAAARPGRGVGRRRARPRATARSATSAS